MSQKDQIIQLLKEKSVMKQDVYKNTKVAFSLFKSAISEVTQKKLILGLILIAHR
jgi:hypothetical protein